MRVLALIGFVLTVACASNATASVPDHPVGFGYKTAWMAVRGGNSRAVSAALHLVHMHELRWQDGLNAVDAADPGSKTVFVTDAVQGWVFVVGTGLAKNVGSDQASTPTALLQFLSSQFGDAQFFGSMRDVDAYAWARAKNGKLVRAFEYDGSEGITLLNVGARSPAESSINFQSPDEEDVLRVARSWSVDPTALNESTRTPGHGIVGDLPS